MTAFAHAAINSGDTLSISIKGVPEGEQGQINGGYPVSKQGMIRMPYLSDKPISVRGLTLDALARKIEGAYKEAKIFTNPTIAIQSSTSMALAEINTENEVKKYLRVTGEVASAGPMAYREGLTLIDVVSMAGTSTWAAKNRVELVRNGKTYKYDMENQAHMMEKVYPDDHIILRKKTFWGK